MRVHPSHAHQSCLQNGTCGRLKKASCSCPIRPYYLDCWCITCIQVGIHEDKAGPMALPRCAPGLSSSSHRHCGSMEHVTAQGEQHGLKPCFRIQFSLFDSLLSGKTLAHILPEKQSGNWLLWWASWLLGYFCILWALCLKGWSHWPQKSLSLSVGFAFFFLQRGDPVSFPRLPRPPVLAFPFPLVYTCFIKLHMRVWSYVVLLLWYWSSHLWLLSYTPNSWLPIKSIYVNGMFLSSVFIYKMLQNYYFLDAAE